jgi:flagellar hook assembly protein FlgD
VNFNVGLPPSDLPLSPAGAASGSGSDLLEASSAGANGSARHLVLRVFDVNGRLVRTLLDDERVPGSYSVVWSGNDEEGKMVSSGVYFLRLDVGQQTLTKKVILSR